MSASSFGNPYLVESEYAWQGRVYLFNFDSIPAGDSLLTDLPTALIIDGNQDFGHVGWDITLVDVNGDGADELISSAPFVEHEVGVVRGYSNCGLEEELFQLPGVQQRSRFGAKMLTLVRRWLDIY